MAGSEDPRTAQVKRTTAETSIRLEVSLDDPGKVEIHTGVGFFDHMLATFARHACLGLKLEAEGDLHVDQHHLVEDVGIALGTALREALGDDLRIVRFAHAYAPMDESLARAVVDVSGRAFLSFQAEITRAWVGGLETQLVREFFQAFAVNARCNLHMDLLRGDNAHHQVEALFKAVALALRKALRKDPALSGVPSTKGTLSEKAAREGPSP
jgi:imidazoleglycerol-phosphate dehydratase